MALSIKEQLDVLTGVVTPSDSSYTLNQLSTQVVINEAQEFIQGAKTVDSGTHPNAFQYRTKYINICNQILTRNRIGESIDKVLIAIYADTGDYATVENATVDQWTAFLESNITAALEVIAGCLPEEKTEYDGL